MCPTLWMYFAYGRLLCFAGNHKMWYVNHRHKTMKSCFILVCLFSSYTTGLSVLPIRKNLPSLKHRSPAAIDPGPDPEPRAVDLYESYLKWIDRSPLIAKSVTAAVVGCLGDVLAQWLETKLATTTSSTIGLSFLSFNWVRFNAFFVSGLFFVGPFLHCTWLGA